MYTTIILNQAIHSKLAAERTDIALLKLIKFGQSSFLKGRYIGQNITTVMGIMHNDLKQWYLTMNTLVQSRLILVPLTYNDDVMPRIYLSIREHCQNNKNVDYRKIKPKYSVKTRCWTN